MSFSGVQFWHFGSQHLPSDWRGNLTTVHSQQTNIIIDTPSPIFPEMDKWISTEQGTKYKRKWITLTFNLFYYFEYTCKWHMVWEKVCIISHELGRDSDWFSDLTDFLLNHFSDQCLSFFFSFVVFCFHYYFIMVYCNKKH